MVWNSDQDAPSSDGPLDPVPRRKLPPKLQQLVDHHDHHDDGFYDDVYSPYSVDSTHTPYRYAAYANRIRTVLLSAHRYVAYTSEIGESFRPVAHPYLVRSAYAISWTYLLGDVGHEGYKAYIRNRHALAPPGEAYKDAKGDAGSSETGGLRQDQVFMGMATGNVAPSEYADGNLMPWSTTRIPLIEDYRTVMAKRAIFQGLASMGLPAFAVHSVVKYSGKMMKSTKSVFLRTWTPVGLGLAIVPFLPYIFDEPIDHAVDWTFHTAIRTCFGEDAVQPLPSHDSNSSSESVSDFLASQNPTGVPVSSASAAMSWDEYREEKLRAQEARRRERAEQGKGGGPWAVLMEWVGGEEKKKGD